MLLLEKDWETLLTRVRNGKCTPFLGAAVNDGILPLGRDIANEWADSFGFPLDTRNDLAKVSQFIAINKDPSRPKELMVEKLKKRLKEFKAEDPDEPLNVLAKLPLSVYLTTNYDNLLVEAIDHHGREQGRRAVMEICRWNRSLARQPTRFRRGSQYTPSPQTPVVYHLHGHHSVLDSIVLTEDDYLDFLVNMSRDESFLPPRIEEAITGCSLIFIGYSLTDINFRVLFRGLLGTLEAALGKMSVAVQLPYEDKNPNKQKAEEYVTQYFGKMERSELKVYWGDARSFARELWERWNKFNA